jgi:hypothetical protein
VRNSVIGTSPACVGVLALTGIILSGSQTRAADECLAAPNSQAPPGNHWHYHVDRSTQRKCWHVRQEDQQDQAGSSGIQQAEKSSAATATATTDEQTKASRQTERARTRPAAAGNKTQGGTSTSDTPKPTAAAAPAISAVDEQPASSDGIDPQATPSAPVVSEPGASASVVEYSGPASAVSFKENARDASPTQSRSTITDLARADLSPQTTVDRADATTESAVYATTFTPIRVLLLILGALALIGVLAFAVFPSRLRRRIHTGRWALNPDAINAHEEASLSFNRAITEPNQLAPQIDMSDEVRRNLRQVLQTLEAQLRGDVEFKEAPLQRRPGKPAWG